MEPIHGRHKFAPEDFISRVPDNVVTNILDRLPLQDAVRTDVLSTTWRFKWTMLSQLVFDFDFFEYLSKTNTKNDHNAGTTFELLGSLPKLQELKLSFTGCRLTEGDAKWRFSTAFSSLKALTLAHICLDDGMNLSCAFELIRSCPNLQTLKITSDNRVILSVCLPASTGRLQYNGAVAAKNCEVDSGTPIQSEDGINALKFLDDDKKHEYLPKNADMRSCFVAGDSFGGNISPFMFV
ncbi:putative F-box/FBD/LRR-repeat protein At3g23955 [Bidens hawaiensis]|uniref:putative F-box/FBD/LRR-repeat protein At3g23955 n=1 Tax=Bidens hawaiensis TaxID=980011 RepID=UPI004048F0A1